MKRVGIDYLEAFDFEDADRRRQAAKHADRVQIPKADYGDGDDKEVFIFADHQAKREKYKAELARLEFEEQIGKLIEAEAVDREWFQLARMVRDALLNIPARLAGVVASESDQRKVHDLIEKEIRQVLTELSHDKVQAA